MNKIIFKAFILTIALFILLSNLTFSQSQEEKIKQLEKRIEQLEAEISKLQAIGKQEEEIIQMIEALKEEVRRLRLEVAMPEIELKSYFGLGPAASKIYYTPRGLSMYLSHHLSKHN